MANNRVPEIVIFVIMVILLVLILLPMVPDLVHSHRNYSEIKSKTKVRNHAQGVTIFAAHHDDQLPTQDQWPDALIEDGIIDFEDLESPVEDGDGISYFYVPGANTFDATQILIYEDPKHWPKRGVLVGFADNHVEFVPFDEFERMLFEQTNKEHD